VEVDGHKFEILTYDTRKSLDPISFEFWNSILNDFPYETVVYELVPAMKPYTAIEQKMPELCPVNSELRRDIDQGDLYVSRSNTEDAAALEHDGVVESFKDDSVILMTQLERAAVFGPGKLLQ